MRVQLKSWHSVDYKREYPTFARGVRTGAIYFMVSRDEGLVVKPAPGAPYGSRYKRKGWEDCWDFLPPGTKLEITV